MSDFESSYSRASSLEMKWKFSSFSLLNFDLSPLLKFCSSLCIPHYFRFKRNFSSHKYLIPEELFSANQTAALEFILKEFTFNFLLNSCFWFFVWNRCWQNLAVTSKKNWKWRVFFWINASQIWLVFLRRKLKWFDLIDCFQRNLYMISLKRSKSKNSSGIVSSSFGRGHFSSRWQVVLHAETTKLMQVNSPFSLLVQMKGVRFCSRRQNFKRWTGENCLSPWCDSKFRSNWGISQSNWFPSKSVVSWQLLSITCTQADESFLPDVNESSLSGKIKPHLDCSEPL